MCKIDVNVNFFLKKVHYKSESRRRRGLCTSLFRKVDRVHNLEALELHVSYMI